MDVIAFLRNGPFAGDESTSRAIVDDSIDSSCAAARSDDWHVIDSIIGFEWPITLNHLFNIFPGTFFQFANVLSWLPMTIISISGGTNGRLSDRFRRGTQMLVFWIVEGTDPHRKVMRDLNFSSFLEKTIFLNFGCENTM